MSHHPTYTMAGLLTIGGLMGYAKGKSVPSLVAGCTLGAGFAAAGYMLQQNSGETGTSTGMRQGHDVALGASTVTTVAMGQRLVASKKALPAGPVVVLGALSTAYHYKKRSEWADVE